MEFIKQAPSVWIVPQRRRGGLWKTLAAALVLLMLSALAMAEDGRGPDMRSLDTQGYDVQAEQIILRLVNQDRQSRGLGRLVMDERLQRAARKHTLRMASRGEVEHQLYDEPKLSLRLGEVAIRYDASGENVARTSGPERAHVALMNSPGHRANILDANFNAIGIGVIHTPDGIYVTEDFARRLPETTVDEAETQVAGMMNRMRAEVGLDPWPRRMTSELRHHACEMAARDRLNPKAGLLSTRVSNAVAFTAADLNKIPNSLAQLKATPASAFSVGACFQSSATYETPVFWFLVITYF
jgi:GNAT superfamily N-acetyltransferase